MAQGFYTRIDTPRGAVLVHVNRRGCKSAWTAADDAALKAIIAAAVDQIAAGKLEMRVPRIPAGGAGAPSTSD